MILIDGSMGEGGGQVLRSSLTLSCLTGQAFRIDGIRAKRNKPGLLRQHLCAVRAITAISGGDVEGDALGSTSLTFRPGTVRGGDHHFAVGTAGSAGLVLQTILLPLLAADQPSTVILEGGTHNDMSPPADFLQHAFVPLLQRMGADLSLELRGHGFYPAGGGRYALTVRPSRLSPIEIHQRGPIRWSVLALSANLPKHVTHREATTAAEALGLPPTEGRVQTVRSDGPGNVVIVRADTEQVTEVFTAFGEKRRSAERVAHMAVEEAKAWEASGMPVGEHLADQLLLPMVVAGGGSFRTVPPSLHTRTNLDVIARFTGTRLGVQGIEGGAIIG